MQAAALAAIAIALARPTLAYRGSPSALVVDVSIPAPLEPLLVPQGSITVDGVSLTVNALPAPGVLQLSLIEFTWRHTTLGALAVGDRVHLEADVIAKHVHRLVAPYVGSVGATST